MKPSTALALFLLASVLGCIAMLTRSVAVMVTACVLATTGWVLIGLISRRNRRWEKRKNRANKETSS